MKKVPTKSGSFECDATGKFAELNSPLGHIRNKGYPMRIRFFISLAAALTAGTATAVEFHGDSEPPRRGATVAIQTEHHGVIKINLRDEGEVLYHEMRPFELPARAECRSKYVGLFKRERQCETVNGRIQDGVRVTRIDDQKCLVSEYAVVSVRQNERSDVREPITLNANQHHRDWVIGCPTLPPETGLWARVTGWGN